MTPPYPSFKAYYLREPIPGRDFDPDGEINQDEYEYMTGTGQYTDTPEVPTLAQAIQRLLAQIEPLVDMLDPDGSYGTHLQPAIDAAKKAIAALGPNAPEDREAS